MSSALLKPITRPLPLIAVTRVMLADFRSYRTLDLALSGRHVVLTGENGAGKTNLLEAISLLSPGRGFRRARLDEMTRQGAERWTVSTALAEQGEVTRIGSFLDTGEEGERSRRIRVDGTPLKSADELTDHVSLLWLTPAQDGLFTGPASDRRRFLDRLVLALDHGHGARMSAFERAMRGRNRLLEDDRWDVAWLSASKRRWRNWRWRWPPPASRRSPALPASSPRRATMPRPSPTRCWHWKARWRPRSPADAIAPRWRTAIARASPRRGAATRRRAARWTARIART